MIKELFKIYWFRFKYGIVVVVEFIYFWLFLRCSICFIWGYKIKECIIKGVNIVVI